MQWNSRIQVGMTFLAAGLALATLRSTGAIDSAIVDDTVAILDTSDKAFGRPLTTVPVERFPELLAGKTVFVHRFDAEGPAGLTGLGPLYVADSCAACHFKDGRGRRPEDPSTPHPPILFRLGTDGDPALGIQLQDRGVDVSPEGQVEITYREEPGHYPDGTTYSLRRPEYRLSTTAPRDAADLPAANPRIPPTLIGLGLLEAVDEAEILALADPDDEDGDGISGRPSWVGPDDRQLGRFGWKAQQPGLEKQVIAALAEDMGIDAASEPAEIAPHHLQALVDYLRFLAPPARRSIDRPDVRRGERLFADLGCTTCHQPTFQTSEAAAPELTSRRIYPYTDLLLHDMGPDLADGGDDADPRRREWRTPPLWGLGLLDDVNGETYFLHDGRARTLEEAILWHGGEAAASRQHFVDLTAVDRKALLAFLDSL